MEPIQDRWIDCFARAFAMCRVQPGEIAAILSETESRPVLVKLAELALLRMKARPFHVVVPTPASAAPVPIRSTGHSLALQEHPAALQALKASSFVVDVTVEGCCTPSSAAPSSQAARASSWSATSGRRSSSAWCPTRR